jgi:hypothetical protein
MLTKIEYMMITAKSKCLAVSHHKIGGDKIEGIQESTSN